MTALCIEGTMPLATLRRIAGVLDASFGEHIQHHIIGALLGCTLNTPARG